MSLPTRKTDRQTSLKGDDNTMKIMIDETIFQGTPVDILEQLRLLTFDSAEFSTTDAYIRFLQYAVRRMTGKPCPLPEGDTEQRAAAILERLEAIGALERLEA